MPHRSACRRLTVLNPPGVPVEDPGKEGSIDEDSGNEGSSDKDSNSDSSYNENSTSNDAKSVKDKPSEYSEESEEAGNSP